MLLLKEIVKKYGQLTAVDHLSLHLHQGEIFGFLGPNGAGKTTTMKMIAGLLSPDEGEIWIDGRDIAQNPLQAKSILGYVPDRPHLYERLTAGEYLDFVGALYRMPMGRIRERGQALLDLFEIGDRRDSLCESFSHGMKQRLILASVLLHNPKLLIVDEPMVGLDPRGAKLLKDTLRKEAQERKMTVLFSTHTLSVAEELCDAMAVIDHGRIVAQGSPEELRALGEAGQSLEAVFLKLTSAPHEES